MSYPNIIHLKAQDNFSLEKLSISSSNRSHTIPKLDLSTAKVDHHSAHTTKHASNADRIHQLFDLGRFLSPSSKLEPMKILPTISSVRQTNQKVKATPNFIGFPIGAPDPNRLNLKESHSPRDRDYHQKLEASQKKLNSRLEPIKLYKLEEISPLETSAQQKTSKAICNELPPDGQASKDGTDIDFFVVNRRKYKIKAPSFTAAPKSPTHYMEDLDMIKTQAKLNFTKKEKNRLGSMSERKLHNTNEVNLLAKNRQEISKEDGVKISLLRKKMEVCSKFEPSITNPEQRKQLFRKFLLEYHSDKTKLDKEFAKEMYLFLIENKAKFISACE